MAERVTHSTSTDEYFVAPKIGWMILILAWLILFIMGIFSPDSALHFLPWPLSDFVYNAGHNHRQILVYISVFLVALHCLETVIALKICQSKRISPTTTAKWCFMTLLFGITSLALLLSYRGKEAGDKRH